MDQTCAHPQMLDGWFTTVPSLHGYRPLHSQTMLMVNIGLARKIHVGVLIPIFPNTMATMSCLKIIRCNVVLLSAVAIPQKKL